MGAGPRPGLGFPSVNLAGVCRGPRARAAFSETCHQAPGPSRPLDTAGGPGLSTGPRRWSPHLAFTASVLPDTTEPSACLPVTPLLWDFPGHWSQDPQVTRQGDRASDCTGHLSPHGQAAPALAHPPRNGHTAIQAQGARNPESRGGTRRSDSLRTRQSHLRRGPGPGGQTYPSVAGSAHGPGRAAGPRLPARPRPGSASAARLQSLPGPAPGPAACGSGWRHLSETPVRGLAPGFPLRMAPHMPGHVSPVWERDNCAHSSCRGCTAV